MIVIQRVRARWSVGGRGAPQANARRGLVRPLALPDSLPSGETVVVHDVVFAEADGYARRDTVFAGGLELARDLDLWLAVDGSAATVERLPGWAAYPRPRAATRLFTLTDGQVGRYRANFRFRGCQCDPSWSYEDWLVTVGNGNARLADNEPDHDVDHRVHLYGGPGRRVSH
ncbi:hypothetical protein [Asanoa hainanensis]|uniref:hypothetical protein n=1 Tax=Asanoa hainanensis TaxID=560556 RepID=UPI001FE2E9FE|nr:hypothetical protein [Asanoa hainanensis]